jgi:hypothetical protein
MAKVVDAVSCSNTSNTTVTGTTNVTVPLKMDASGLAKALQAAAQAQAAQPAMSRINPADVIKAAATRMEDLYTRFNALKQIGAELHGKSLSDAIPESLKIEEISFKFTTVKDGKESEPTTAVIKNVICVGDIANLLSTELGTIILTLQQEAAAVRDTAQQTEETCTKARESWEANNPDRRVVAPTEAPAISAAPITLQAQNETPAL